MYNFENDYFGDNPRFFVGIVEQAGGEHGAARIRCFGIHSPFEADIPMDNLPWASVVVPVTFGGIGASVPTPSLQPGAMVFGFFMDGEQSQIPLILGVVPKTEIIPKIDAYRLMPAGSDNASVNRVRVRYGTTIDPDTGQPFLEGNNIIEKIVNYLTKGPLKLNLVAAVGVAAAVAYQNGITDAGGTNAPITF